MSEITRYDIDEYGMHILQDGDYVRYIDYVKLQDESKELMELLCEVKNTVISGYLIEQGSMLDRQITAIVSSKTGVCKTCGNSGRVPCKHAHNALHTMACLDCKPESEPT